MMIIKPLNSYIKKAQICCSSLVIESAPIVLGTVLVDASVNDSFTFHGI